MEANKYSEEDRRSFERVKLELPIRFKITPENIEGDFILRDVCGNGLGVVSKKRLSPESNIDLWVKIPDNKPELHIKGKVVWSREVVGEDYRTGIVFEQIDLMPLWRIFREARVKATG